MKRGYRKIQKLIPVTIIYLLRSNLTQTKAVLAELVAEFYTNKFMLPSVCHCIFRVIYFVDRITRSRLWIGSNQYISHEITHRKYKFTQLEFNNGFLKFIR